MISRAPSLLDPYKYGARSPEPLSVCDLRLACHILLTAGANFAFPPCAWRELWWRRMVPPPPKRCRLRESSSEPEPEPIEVDPVESDDVEPMEVDLPPEDDMMEVDPPLLGQTSHHATVRLRKRSRPRDRRRARTRPPPSKRPPRRRC